MTHVPMREVENTPNRCPVCQRVQMTPFICHSCEVKAIVAQDMIDLLDIIDKLAEAHSGHGWPQRQQVRHMIATMRIALHTRLNPGDTNVLPSDV